MWEIEFHIQFFCYCLEKFGKIIENIFKKVLTRITFSAIISLSTLVELMRKVVLDSEFSRMVVDGAGFDVCFQPDMYLSHERAYKFVQRLLDRWSCHPNCWTELLRVNQAIIKDNGITLYIRDRYGRGHEDRIVVDRTSDGKFRCREYAWKHETKSWYVDKVYKFKDWTVYYAPVA